MWSLIDGKVFNFKDFKANKNCSQCGGCGYVAFVRQDLDASKFREMRPCQCVKKVVRIKGEVKK